MDLDLALRRVIELRRLRPDVDNWLDLYCHVLKFQKDTLTRLGGELPPPPNIEKIKDRPLIEYLKGINGDLLSRVTGEFLDLMARSGTQKMKELSKELIPSKCVLPDVIKDAFIGYIVDGSFPDEVPCEFFRFTAFSVIPVFLMFASSALSMRLPRDFESTNCPFCGSKAQVGYLRASEEGRRYLVCPVCYGEWHIRRDRCAGCGREGLDESYYLFVEGSREYSHCLIDICDTCKGYIKSIDERVLNKKGEPCVPLVEDIATLHLDLRACDEGYIKVNPSLFGF